MEKNKRSKRNKKILAGAGALACIALLAGTYAWLQSEDTRTNKFTGVLSGNDVTINELWEEPDAWTPGQEVVKEVGIMNTGEYDEFVRVSFKEALALLKNVAVQESNTLPTIVPAFFDPINPQTEFYGFAVQIGKAETDENGKLVPGKTPELEDRKNAKKDYNDLAAFKKFMADYGLTYTVVVNKNNDGYELKYEGDAPNTSGWLIPVSDKTITALKANEWTDVTITDAASYTLTRGTAPNVQNYELVALGSPIKDIPNPNKAGAMIHVRDYKFYWKTTEVAIDEETGAVGSKVVYYQSAGIDSTKTNYDEAKPADSTVTLESEPKIAFISAAYQDTKEVQWWASVDPANASIGQLYQPWKANTPEALIPGTQELAGAYAAQPFAALVAPATSWWTNSNVQVASTNTTKTKAEIAIDFVNMSSAVPTDKKAAQKWYYNEADGFFYYLDVLGSGQTTSNIIDKVKLENGAGNEYMKLHYNLDVKAQAIQSLSDAAKDEWKVTGALFDHYKAIETGTAGN